MNHLVIMLKEPHPGRVKTRLGRELGMVTAAWWFRHQSARLIRTLAADPRWQVWLAISPDSEGLQSRIWPAHLPRLPQGSGHLGRRMVRQFRTLPPGPALIIGADIPGITTQRINAAFTALRGADAVLGPAPDGGYWCIGLRHGRALPLHSLDPVRWSTQWARADTQAALKGKRIALSATLSDVDTAADLRAANQNALMS